MLTERLTELGLEPETIALARGMITGDKSDLSRESLKMFRAAGMSHLLAVSGLHVGIIMTIIYTLLKPIEWGIILFVFSRQGIFPTRWHYLIVAVKVSVVIATTLLYIWSIGFPPSAVRAWVMLSLMLAGTALHRNVSQWQTWLTAAIVLLIYDPMAITQPGFQLSFLAVAGILVCKPFIKREDVRAIEINKWQNRLVFRVKSIIIVTLAAQALTMPVVAYTFHQVPLLGWVQGILVIPLIPVFVMLLLVGLAFPSAHFIAYPIEWLRLWMEQVALKTTKVEEVLFGGHLYLYPTWWEALLLGIAILSLILILKLRTRSKLLDTV